MTRRILLFLMLSLAGLSFGFMHLTEAIEKTRNDKNKFIWHTFDRGIELAKKEKKMLVIDVYTDWCHWCKVMDRDTYANPEVVRLAKEKLVMVKLDAETNERFKFRDARYSGRQLSMMLGVQGFPTTVFMSSDGELITSISGFIPADRFIVILKYLDGKWYDQISFDDFLKKEAQKN